MGGRFHNTILIGFLLAVMFAGCGRKYRLDRDLVPVAGESPCWRGQTAQTGTVAPSDFNGSLNELWTKGISGKPVGPLAIHHDVLILPDSKRRLRFVDLATGRVTGSYKAKGVPQTGLAVLDTLGFYGVAPKKKFVRAVNLARSKRLWQTSIKDALAGPIILDNRLIVSSSVGQVLALELETGEPAWTFEAGRRLVTSASYAEGRLYQPGDRGMLFALSSDDGAELFRTQLTGPLVSPVALADKLYAADMLGHVYALDPSDGREIWQVDLAQPTWTSPVVADGKIMVGHSNGKVVALGMDDGRELWRFDAGSVVKASPLVIGNYLVIGTMSGKVMVVKTDDGQLVDSTSVKGAVKYPPVTDGGRLFIATQAGKIICFGERNEQAAYADRRVQSEDQPQ